MATTRKPIPTPKQEFCIIPQTPATKLKRARYPQSGKTLHDPAHLKEILMMVNRYGNTMNVPQGFVMAKQTITLVLN